MPNGTESQSSFPLNVIEGVAIGNLKAIAEQPAMLSNMAYSNMVANTNLSLQNAVSNQQAMNELNVSVTAASVNAVKNIGPLQARSAVDVLTNNELASEITALKGTLAAFGGGGTSGGGGRLRPIIPPAPALGTKTNPYPRDATIYAKLPTEFVAVNVADPAKVEIASRTEDGTNAVLKLQLST